MSRAVTEWIAEHDDQAIPARVKVRVFDKCGKRCCICTLEIRGSLRPEYDHIVALINSGQHRESNLQVLCSKCHSDKTRDDVAIKSRTYRKRKANLGIKRPRRITRWRRFDGSIREAGRER